MSTDSRIAVVTGAAQGIGREIALRLADDGIDVAVNDIANNANNLADVVKAIQAKGRRSVLLLADVSNEDEVRSMVEMTVEKLGGLDIMVANAGIAQAVALVDINSTEAWDRTMSVNVRGPMLCYKYAALQMIKQGRGGRIIGTSLHGLSVRQNVCWCLLVYRSVVDLRKTRRKAIICLLCFEIRRARPHTVLSIGTRKG